MAARCAVKVCCGRSDLGGEQTWRPEHKEITAAPKNLPYGSRGMDIV